MVGIPFASRYSLDTRPVIPLMLVRRSKTCGLCARTTVRCCARCGVVFYCTKECQTEDWKLHKFMCVPIAQQRSSVIAMDGRAHTRLEEAEVVVFETEDVPILYNLQGQKIMCEGMSLRDACRTLTYEPSDAIFSFVFALLVSHRRLYLAFRSHMTSACYVFELDLRHRTLQLSFRGLSVTHVHALQGHHDTRLLVWDVQTDVVCLWDPLHRTLYDVIGLNAGLKRVVRSTARPHHAFLLFHNRLVYRSLHELFREVGHDSSFHVTSTRTVDSALMEWSDMNRVSTVRIVTHEPQNHSDVVSILHTLHAETAGEAITSVGEAITPVGEAITPVGEAITPVREATTRVDEMVVPGSETTASVHETKCATAARETEPKIVTTLKSRQVNDSTECILAWWWGAAPRLLVDVSTTNGDNLVVVHTGPLTQILVDDNKLVLVERNTSPRVQWVRGAAVFGKLESRLVMVTDRVERHLEFGSYIHLGCLDMSADQRGHEFVTMGIVGDHLKIHPFLTRHDSSPEITITLPKMLAGCWRMDLIPNRTGHIFIMQGYDRRWLHYLTSDLRQCTLSLELKCDGLYHPDSRTTVHGPIQCGFDTESLELNLRSFVSWMPSSLLPLIAAYV
jgi:hypothetical protein